jgi:hypothetical protein
MHVGELRAADFERRIEQLIAAPSQRSSREETAADASTTVARSTMADD